MSSFCLSDIFYFALYNAESGPMDTANGITNNRSSGPSRSLPNVVENDIDEQLWKLDGKIQRKRDEKL